MENESVTTLANPGMSRSAADVETIVRGRLNGRVRAFQLIAESQVLVLRSRTRTYYAKQLAQHMVMEISALQILANDIEVVNGDEP
jgi:hypothetical protein